MSPDNLFRYVVGQTDDLLVENLSSWMQSTPGFLEFVRANRDKIRKKFADARDREDKVDAYTELLFACLLLQRDGTSLRYVPEGHPERKPDFTVSMPNLPGFALEVKRIRLPELERRWEEWRERIGRRVSAIPSDLAFSLNFCSPLDLPCSTSFNFSSSAREDVWEDMIRWLTEPANEERVFSVIRSAIEKARGALQHDRTLKQAFCDLNPPHDVLVLELSRPPGKEDRACTDDYGGPRPVFYRQSEKWKFLDIVLGSLGQLVDSLPTVLAIMVESSSHEVEDLEIAMDVLTREQSLERKTLMRKLSERGMTEDDLATRIVALSAVLFRGWGSRRDGDSNYLWCNPRASHPLPDGVIRFLRGMDFPNIGVDDDRP
jgi:hypothetical protein